MRPVELDRLPDPHNREVAAMFTLPPRHDPQRMTRLEYAVALLGILYVVTICTVAADFRAMNKRIAAMEAAHGSP